MKSNLLLLLALMLLVTSAISAPNQQLPAQGQGPWVVNVYYQNLSQLKTYAQYNQPWSVDTKEKYFTVGVDNIQQYEALFGFGFEVEINQDMMLSSNSIKDAIAKNINIDSKSIPGYACYRTVEETFATMDSLVANNPTLASIVTIGVSWEKATPGGNPGYDMRVLKITNSAITGTKPILFATSSIHARELTPAELTTRFAEYLLNNYGTDADATWLVDHREIHLLLQGNPDGRKIAETGAWKRKNENNNFCANQSTKGIDMNRNFAWMWNQGSGSSGSACDQVFRGPSAQSEYENDAIDTHLKTLFIDARGANLADAAPTDTTGVFLDIHSYSELILWPYGFDSPGVIPLAPNHNQLRTLGRKFAWYNSYYPQASNQLYGADGASDDNAYGQLGVASYTFELGTEFFQSCNIFENTILPDNLKALVYAAKVADTPYITASGPDIEAMMLSANDVAAGMPITVTGVATDTHFNNNNGSEPTQNITSVAMFVDELPWDNTSVPMMMTATDGDFNTNSEAFTGQINTTGLSAGQHVIYIQTTDTSGITGVPYAKFFNIVDPNDLGTVSGIIKDAMTNLPIDVADISLGSQQLFSNAQGQFDFSITAGVYSLSASKQGYATASINNISVTALQNTSQDILLQPVCSLLDDNADSYSSIAAAVTAGWGHAADAGVDDWSIDATGGIASSKAFSTQNVGSITDKFLISPELSLTTDSTLEFWHKYDFEEGSAKYDGALLEISTNNGSSWTDLGSNIITGAYNGVLDNSFGNPIGGRAAWGGTQSSFAKVEVGLSAFAGTTAKIRWRFGADSSQAAGAWKIDDIKVLDPSACVNLDIIFKTGFE